MTEYIASKLKNDIVITKLFSVHYFEFSKDYKFSGEKHDFWEFVYIDKGEATIIADKNELKLKQGDIIFHKPNEWHNIYSNGVIAPNIAIASFECKSEAMKFFENKILQAGQEQKRLISKIISEYTNAFSTPLDNPFTNRMYRKKTPLIGSEQLIKQYLSELLILFLRDNYDPRQFSSIKLNHSNSVLNTITNYMLDNIDKNITIEDLVKYTGISKTVLANVFKTHLNSGVIEYFITLKTEVAKKYLREENYNISQISEKLGYSGIHYFSRQFKKVTGMSPTQYAKSIKSLNMEI